MNCVQPIQANFANFTQILRIKFRPFLWLNDPFFFSTETDDDLFTVKTGRKGGNNQGLKIYAPFFVKVSLAYLGVYGWGQQSLLQ